ncbi:MAG TPA: caspase family protein, partial [Kofleriaceae bacterium]
DLATQIGGELTERDRLLVYFAGHGVSLPSERGPEGWLLLADADAADQRSFFAMRELRTLISALPCRHVMIILDCCFAGTFRWAGPRGERDASTRVYRESLDRFVRHRAWQVLVSAGHDQAALDTAASGRARDANAASIGALATLRIETEAHSPFAAALLRGLAGAADYTGDGLIVATELELYVRDAVERSTRIQQTPQLHKLDEHDRGEFVFQVPGTTLALEPAPALSLVGCPYQGLRPYSAAERDRFFGRGRVIADLVDRVKARPLTVVLGSSGAGKSSLVAAGLVPVLRDTGHWTVIEARPGPATHDMLRDAITVPAGVGLALGPTLLDRITAWLSAHPSGQLCLVIDQAEALMLVAGAEACARTLADLAHALSAHGSRVRVVLALRSEFELVFRTSALGPLWAAGVFPVPALAHHELREIIEQPARSIELAFEPPALVDTLIGEVLQAPGGLPLLSFALRELYVRCAERNRDRLLAETDYADMGRLSGALAQRASQLLDELIARDRAYEATARRVFLIEYDDRGDGVELAWFDEAGHPARNLAGVARSHMTYDERATWSR